MKKLTLSMVSLISVLLFLLTSCSLEQPKYQKGDCITPTSNSYSWYGEYAWVESYSRISGYSGKNYILAFPKSASNNTIFGKEIEAHTKKVSLSKC